MDAQNRLCIRLCPDLVTDQHVRCHHTQRRQKPLCTGVTVQHIGVQSHIIAWHALLHRCDLASPVNERNTVFCPEQPAHVPQHGGLSGADCTGEQDALRSAAASLPVQLFCTSRDAV